MRMFHDAVQREHAPARWRAAGRPGDAIPYPFPVRGRRPLALDRIDALMGAHSFDATTRDYGVLARDIAAQGWPTVIVMEGGYAVDALGHNVAALLGGF